MPGTSGWTTSSADSALVGLQEALPRVPGQPDQQPVLGPCEPLQLQRAPAGLPQVQGGRQPPGGRGELRLLQQTAGGAVVTLNALVD